MEEIFYMPENEIILSDLLPAFVEISQFIDAIIVQVMRRAMLPPLKGGRPSPDQILGLLAPGVFGQAQRFPGKLGRGRLDDIHF